MPGRFRTLRDLDLMEGERAPEKPSGRVPAMKVKHIPHLPDADAALRLLNRIHREFYPIVERRGYHVLSLSEMCCCGDGLDHDESKKRKRKLRKMGLNVLGYNVSHPNGTHTIHLRLRDAHNHNRLLPYEDVAGTMSHELAHCVHGPHKAPFYKLMDEIQEQHAVFMVRGIVADKQGFPVDSHEAYTLGGATTGGGRALEAALARQQRAKWMPQGPQKLGGDSGFRSCLAPGQAAGMAAEARRLRDEVWCQPCQASDIIELSDSDEEQDEVPHVVAQNEMDDRKPAATTVRNEAHAGTGSIAQDGVDNRKPAAVTLSPQRDAKNDTKTRPASVVTIDLTTSDDEDSTSPVGALEGDASVPARGCTRPKQRRRCHDQHASAHGDDKWSCPKCTFVNGPLALACGMCGTESQPLVSTMKVAAEIRRKDEIEYVKETEVQRSKDQFGFNIYGKVSQVTAKLNHIT